MPSRPQKSNATKKAQGNPGKRPLIEPIQGEPGVPDKPIYLNECESGYWDYYTLHLERRGGLNKSDGPALADMCVCCARLEEAEQIIRTTGLLIPGERGMVKNPALQLSRNYRQQVQKYFELFGVCPAPRGRMNIPEDDDDGDEAFQGPSKVNDYTEEE